MGADVRRARALTPLLCALVGAVGCPDERARDGLVGWPDLDVMRSERAAAAAPPEPADTLQATDTVAADTAPDGAAPIAYDAGADGFASTGDPCRDVVELACGLLGVHSDACAEARRDVPSSDHPETRDGCHDLVERFLTTELSSHVSPCRRLARAVCRDEGNDATACREAKNNVAVLRREWQKRACLGDLLMREARPLRR